MEKRRVIITITFFLVFFIGCSKRQIRRTYTISRIVLLPSANRLYKRYKIHGKVYYPVPGLIQRGIASWYGRKFHGRKTASGEIYNMYARTAAHKTLPFGTYVLVRNLKNNKTTVVRINDRGPFVKGRIIDLSYTAAKDIGMIGTGTAPVELVVLGREVGKIHSPTGKKPVVEVRDIERGKFGVQVAAFRNKKNALRLVDRLSVIFKHVEVQVDVDEHANTLYRVVVGGANTTGRANELQRKIKKMGFEDAFIIRL